jgi:hypothetical protein
MKFSVKSRPLKPNELGGIGNNWAMCFYDSTTFEIYGYIAEYKNSISFINIKKNVNLDVLKEIINKYEKTIS